MTLTKVIAVQGCAMKERGEFVFVDLSEPEKIGKHPNHSEQYCHESPLQRTVYLAVNVTGKELVQDDTKHAEVVLSCIATDCPLHEKHNKTIS